MVRLQRLTRLTHKLLGLFLIPYGVLMGLSGILVNHPEWIESCELPLWLVPEQYVARDFERETLRQLVYSQRDPHVAYLGGSEGVWRSRDGGRTFAACDGGFPVAAAQKDTHALLLIEDETRNVLLAGTDHGLFALDVSVPGERWQRVPLGSTPEPVRSLLRIEDDLVAVTTSDAFRAHLPTLAFEALDLRRHVTEDAAARRTNLVTYLFDLHSGALFGWLGKLLYDVVGVVTAFLSVSAFYLWYHPRNTRRRRQRQQPVRGGRTTARSVFRWLLRTHLKIGIWISPILVVMAATGLFMRPPLIMVPAQASLDAAWHWNQPSLERLDGRILRVHHEATRRRILLEAKDGFYATDDRFEQPLEEIDFPLPVHVMGTNVLTTDRDGALIAGSFSGGFRLDPLSGDARDLMTTEIARDVSRMRLASHMVTGYFETPAGERFATTFEQGIVPIGDARRDGRFQMPDAMRNGQTLSLWKFAFELHNGRYFRDWIGFVAFLLPILGSLLFLLLTATGVYDWIAPRLRARGASEE